MTLAEACDTASRLAGSQIPMEQKVKWISTLDTMLHREILLRHRLTRHCPFAGYDGSTDPEQKLLVDEPYDEIYRWYLEMQIHDANGELARYNNAAQKFNSALLAFGDYINRSFPPLGREQLRLY